MSKAITKAEAANQVSLPANEGATILGMIDRIMTMPDMPVERIEQMFALHQKVQADQARKNFDAAFAEMQPNLPVIGKRGKGHNSKYAKWEDIVEQVQPVLSSYGFGISFRTTDAGGKLRVTAILSHRDGHREENYHDLPADKSGNKNDIQAIGSSTSYGKRYAACSLLNIVSREEDDDGQAGGSALISEEQADELMRLIRDTNTKPDQFTKLAKVETISDIKAANFDILKGLLETKKKNLQKAQSEAPV